MFRTLAIFSLLSVVFTLISCSVKMTGPEMGRETETAMFESLLRYNARVRTLDARATVIYKDESSALSFRASMMYDYDGNRFRMDLHDFVFGKPVLTVVRNGDRVLTIIHTRGERNLQPYDEFDLKKITGLSIPKELLLSSIIGKVYLGEGNRELFMSGKSTLVVKTPQVRSDVDFGRDGLPYRVKYLSNLYNYELSFIKFEKPEDIPFPLKIVLKDASRMLTVNYSSFSINIELNPEDFLIDEKLIAGSKTKSSPDMYQNEHMDVYFLTHIRVSHFFN